ncbi:MAG: hypothetical protein JRI23_26665 [Deltaproteobacteria bacterium]|jgi:hypothetical protein|nr:hypothetical protein [Deltaproteobacteria bacterium]MBW2535629.1 hypothetical protein [Deltaproteobacteria bacterium]
MARGRELGLVLAAVLAAACLGGCSDDDTTPTPTTTPTASGGTGGDATGGTGGDATGGTGGDATGGAGGSAGGNSVPSPAMCPDGFDQDSGTVFYVDPQNGDDSTGDGSQSSPWASIQHVIDNRVDCTDEGGTPWHSNAPVKAGDTIKLVGAAGHDLDLDINGCFNTDYVTIKAAVLHEPVLRNIHFRGSAYWRIDGLSLEGGTMFRIEDTGTHGEVHHIQLFNNHLTSGDLVTAQDFLDHTGTAIWLLHGPEYITIQCNHLIRVGQAITASGSHLDVIANTIEYFSLDGIATGGSHNRFLGNRIYDSIKTGDGNHDDFFQSHMGANPDTSSDVEIAYNIFMNRYTDAYPMSMQYGTQCCSAFGDGPKTDIRIYNNVCKTDHFHGLTWNDTNDSLFINNTVVGGTDLPGLPTELSGGPAHTWISVSGTGNVVRNNITTMNNAGGDHNLEITGNDVYDYFVDWDDLDLHLQATAAAVDGGSADQAPADDLEGTPRDGVPDVGAYEFVPGP